MYFFPRRRRQKRQEKPGSTWKLRSWTRSWKETCRSWRWEAPWTPRGSTRRMTGTASPSISRWVSSSNLCGKFFSYHKTFTMISAQSNYCPCPCAWVWWCVMCVGRLAQWWTIQWTSIIPGFPRRPGREPWWRSCWPTPSSDSKSDTLVLLDFGMSHKAALQWQLHLYSLSLYLNGSTVFSGTSFVYSIIAFWLIQVLTTNTDAKWWQCVICDHLISFWRH